MSRKKDDSTDDTDDENKIKFTVDTHLFRELGELLVGRDSTALIELVKNAYDADATEVTVFGERLSDTRNGVIRIVDNGVGMDPETFRRGFLRVASRLKSEGTRRSERLKRSFTGAKGIGRLAAHKLARRLDVQSVPWTEDRDAVGVNGTIDWDKVESVETLDDIQPDAVSATAVPIRRGARHGTTLTLTRLRKRWTDKQRAKFLLEVEALRAPLALIRPVPKAIVPAGTMLESPMVTDGGQTPFSVNLEGDFETGEDFWSALLDSADWMLEIDATSRSVKYAIAPTRRKLRETPFAKSYKFTEPQEDPDNTLSFQARMFLREGTSAGSKDEKTWASRVAGVRVYMEGFRVLPYGDEADDWLYLAQDYSTRNRNLRFLSDSGLGAKLDEQENEGLSLPTGKQFFGGVFLTTSRASTLQMLVNREGFVPDASHDQLVRIVRTGIDLLTRVRVGVISRVKAERAEAERAKPERAEAEGAKPEPASPSGGSAVGRVADDPKGSPTSPYTKLREQQAQLERLAAAAPPDLRPRIVSAAAEIGHATAVAEASLPETSMVLVLASVGTQHAAFTHEMGRLLGLASDLEVNISRLRDQEVPPKMRTQVNRVAGLASDLRRALERQAAYLVDIVTPDSRRRRSRLKVADTLNEAWKLVETSAAQREIDFANDVDEHLRTRPMFRAELLAVFSNLFTNAVKAAGKDGAVRATANLASDNTLRIRIENTGVAIDPSKGERWFRPFESTTVRSDPVLGQGMGLGLGITRKLLSEVGASVQFVGPRRGFATCVEITMPDGSK